MPSLVSHNTLPDFIIGIDPGLAGSFCVLDTSDLTIQYATFSDSGDAIHSNDIRDVESIIEGLESDRLSVAIENPPLFVGGGRSQPASRLSKLRESYGYWRGFFHHFNPKLLAPARWQNMYGTPSGDDHKHALAHAAVNLYPELEELNNRDLLSVCDAVLICNFMLRQIYG